MSFKRLFSRSLAAAPGRLHFAAHSHHLWPDASFAAHLACWEDAARLADRKWDKVMGEVWPKAQADVAAELSTGRSDAVVFSANTHDFIIRLVTAAPRRGQGPLRILTSDGEFHSARRQFARWVEEGWITLEMVAAEPFDDFSDRFLAAARAGEHDLVLVSQVLFGSGRRFDRVADLAALAHPDGPWIVIDGYHAFMTVPQPLGATAGGGVFYLGGGYKYAMAGEGVAFLHAPPGYGPRPTITGWYAEFGDLTAPPGGIGYTRDAMRYMGATFDPSALYRFTAVQAMLRDEGLTTAAISAHAERLQRHFLESIAGSALADAALLNPVDGEPHARFLAFRTPEAGRWCAELMAQDCITDHRGDVWRIGFGLYQDEEDVDRLAARVRALA